MIKFKNFKSIFVTSILTIGISVITSQSAFAATLTAKTYTVKSGDCLYTIAQKYGETLNNLRKDNNTWNDLIFPDQILKVSVTNSYTPQQTTQMEDTSFKIYTVKSGDCLYTIAQKYEETLNNLRKDNNTWNDLIFPGQVLNVSVATSPVIQQTINLGNKKLYSMITKSECSKLNTGSVKQKSKVSIHLWNNKASSTITSSGSESTYRTKYIMNATAYTGGGLTAMGLRPVRNLSGISTIAVDPSVIPLGTKVYIPGYGNAICSDTGGLIKGNIIDLYMNSGSECINWGRRTVTLYIR